jgi:RNA polymerase sigma-70 factor (ECF subfamily)
MLDEELLERWRAGDDRAGGELFDRHYDLVERFFATKVSYGAEDLIQATFEACVKGRDRIREGARFRAYLLAIARHQLIAHYREQRARRGSDEGEELSAVRDGGMSPSMQAVQREEQIALLAALRGLPIDQQLVLELHYWEEMSTEDIADVLEIPQGTVKSRLRLAREALEQRLARDAPADVSERTISSLESWARSLRDLTERDRR